jgi:dCMP deaminase
MEEVKQVPQEVKNIDIKEENHARPSWDEYFLGLLEPLSKRGSCDRGSQSAMIVSPGHTIIATGYAGSPPGMPHCDEAGHMMNTVIHEDGTQSQHCVRTIHGEENAILQCAKDGVKIEGGTMYMRMSPCYNCAMRIIRVGIKRVVSQKKYHAGQKSIDMLEKCGVKVDIMENEVMQYKNQ